MALPVFMAVLVDVGLVQVVAGRFIRGPCTFDSDVCFLEAPLFILRLM